MQTIWAEQALLGDHWNDRVLITVTSEGRIGSIETEAAPEGERVGILLPSPGNVHSHAFQRAMAGLTEQRGPNGQDTFWTWRNLMFRFLDALKPDDIEAIAAFVQMEMMEAGYAAVGEFHYLHHQADGSPYADIGELTARVAAAAKETGIGLTLLPVLYGQAGCDGSALGPGQVRFGNDVDRFHTLHNRAAEIVKALPKDAVLGVAPHSLRAVSQQSLRAVIDHYGEGPLHMHLAEQTGEVEEVLAAYGIRPVEWLLENHDIDQRWCLIHCTQMTSQETSTLARTGAVAGLCPITEASLGDGIFNGVEFLGQGGVVGIGSDSNIRISLSEELRQLEYSQRLRDRHRAVLATSNMTTGRRLFSEATRGGAQALGRTSGEIRVGNWADLVALNSSAIDLADKRGDTCLDAFIFAGDDRMVTDLWSAGRHMVSNGVHVARPGIEAAYRRTMTSLIHHL